MSVRIVMYCRIVFETMTLTKLMSKVLAFSVYISAQCLHFALIHIIWAIKVYHQGYVIVCTAPLIQIVKRNVIENLLPVVISAKHLLEQRHSPLLRDMLYYLKELMQVRLSDSL